MVRYYRLDGHTPVQCDVKEAAFAFDRPGGRTVGYTAISTHITVSTVFLVIDHNFSGYGAPVLFETMVFGGLMDEHTERYCTWDEAAAGHTLMVERVKDAEIALALLKQID